MSNNKTLQLLGAAWGLGAKNHGCADGPAALQQASCLQALMAYTSARWRAIIDGSETAASGNEAIAELCGELAQYTHELCQQRQPFLTLGGDHSCAIGSWSGASSAVYEQGPMGMIWIDAHMDSHTQETSPSGAVHGMPVACLLGYGDVAFTHLATPAPKVQAQHISLIGVRSYEEGEAKLLQELDVRIFFIEEVRERGLDAVLRDALDIATTGTVGYGLSIDLDALDPQAVPGVGSPVANGLDAHELAQALHAINGDPRLIGAEIAEYNPHLDKDEKTQMVVCQLAQALFA